jgi:hypothetical protein
MCGYQQTHKFFYSTVILFMFYGTSNDSTVVTDELERIYKKIVVIGLKLPPCHLL